MSENTPLDTATETVAKSPTVAPPPAGDPQGSTPAPVDPTVPSEPKPPEGEQKPRRDRAFATLRRENRDLHRTIGRLEERMETILHSLPKPAEGEQPQRRERTPEQQQAAREAEEHALSVIERIEEAGEEIEGFDKVVSKLHDPSLPINRVMLDYLATTDKPAQMAQWLAENASEVRRISRLSDAVAVRALERAEAKLSPTPVPRSSKPPPPPPPTVGGGSSAATRIETMNHEDIRKLVSKWSKN